MIILSQVAKIALKIVFKLKLFPYKIIPSLVRVLVQTLGGLLTAAVPLQSDPNGQGEAVAYRGTSLIRNTHPSRITIGS